MLKQSTVNSFILHECDLTIKRLQRQPKARNDPARNQARYDWVMKYDSPGMDSLRNCIFIDKSGFDINMRPSYGRSASGAPAIASTPSAKAESHSILGAIATVGVVNIEIRIIYYLDDICLLAKTKQEMDLLTTTVRYHLEKLGFIINYKKSILLPSKTQEFLGFLLNSKTITD